MNELGLAPRNAGPSSSNNEGASFTSADSSRVERLSPLKPGTSRQSRSSLSTDDGGEPPFKRLNERSSSEAFVDDVCRQEAPCVDEFQSESAGTSSCEQSDSDSSSSDKGGPQGSESSDESDDFVASDSCTGPDEGIAFTCSPTLTHVLSEQLSASEEFAVIASKHNMTHACINDVLDFCRRRGISDLPKDARTVLKTERKAQVEQNGSFVHFGLAEGIRQVLQPGQVVPSELKLQGNIDGVPLYKSSQLAFWPILCRITNVEASPPFVVSVYCGAGKPPCLQDYLEPFLQEVSDLISEGISIGDVHVRVSIGAMVCDAPARSYVKCIVGHTGYYACERCNQKGQHLENRVTFPRLHAAARTNASFRSQENKHHHSGVSPFLSLDVDMIAFFPSEYMHLVCLGVMRRLLRNWVDLPQPCGHIKEGRLKADKAKQLQEALDTEQQTVAKETRVWIRIADCGSHRNHGFEDMEAFSQNMDRNIAERIQMLAREGITSVSDVKKCLHYYVHDVLIANKEKPDSSCRAFFATHRDISNQIQAVLKKDRFSTVDQENASILIEKIRGEQPESSIVYRPYAARK
ncbi:hypothetical protein HPB49_003106 [Dermacentor silvarum]|uniref:Uncharacterized protein n=1 Tax=Dermacentor silvarum TaxID=543639 RepID=A0ACB8DAP0_DERSI|nr:hypothetical protein HPB49_003106 [Dermacentor silvarum]